MTVKNRDLTVFLTVGLPGSGKSTWSERYAREHGLRRHSSDEIRGRLYGDESSQGDGSEVFGLLRREVLDDISHGNSVVIDCTSLHYSSRRSVMEYRMFGCRLIAVVMDTPVEECFERNARRQRKVPEDVMRRMAERMTLPGPSEGFDEVWYVDGTGKVRRSPVNLFLPRR